MTEFCFVRLEKFQDTTSLDFFFFRVFSEGLSDPMTPNSSYSGQLFRFGIPINKYMYFYVCDFLWHPRFCDYFFNKANSNFVLISISPHLRTWFFYVNICLSCMSLLSLLYILIC